MRYDIMRRAYAVNAEQLRGMADRAARTGKKVNGYTAEQLQDGALAYALLAGGSDADIATHLAQTKARIAATITKAVR